MTRPLSEVARRDRYNIDDGPQREYRIGWNDAMGHVARECLPVLAGLRELRDATPIIRPHDWPGIAELADFDLGGEAG